MTIKQERAARSGRSAGRSTRLRPLIIGYVGAVMVGLLVTLLVKNFSALSTEAGGSCGTSRGISSGPCPRGIGWMLPLSFIGLFLFVPVLVAGLARSRAGRWAKWASVPLLLVGGLLALPIFMASHGPTLKTVWAAPGERSTATEESLGSWQHGSLVMRARFDAVIAYEVATGRRAWVYDIPTPQVLCAMSRTADKGIGLIGHADEHKPCTGVTAVDLTTGRALWTRSLPADSLSGSSVDEDVIAVAGDTVVARTERDLRAFTLREGGRPWTVKTTDRCRFRHVVGGGDQFITELTCADAQPKIRAIDAATGRTRWETVVPIRGTSASITLLSASPSVVRVIEGGQRGTDVLAAFDATGRITAQIRVNDGQRRLDLGGSGFDAMPVRPLLIGDRGLVISGNDADQGDMVYAYELSDGRERWSTELPEDVGSMAMADDRIVAVEDTIFNPRVYQLSLRTGERSDLGVITEDGNSSEQELYVTGGHYVLVSERGSGRDAHPLMVLRSEE